MREERREFRDWCESEGGEIDTSRTGSEEHTMRCAFMDDGIRKLAVDLIHDENKEYSAINVRYSEYVMSDEWNVELVGTEEEIGPVNQPVDGVPFGIDNLEFDDGDLEFDIVEVVRVADADGTPMLEEMRTEDVKLELNK